MVSRKSKAETVSSTIQEAEEEEEQEEEEEEEEEKEKKQEKQFLKTSSLASLLPRYFGKYFLLSLNLGSTLGRTSSLVRWFFGRLSLLILHRINLIILGKSLETVRSITISTLLSSFWFLS